MISENIHAQLDKVNKAFKHVTVGSATPSMGSPMIKSMDMQSDLSGFMKDLESAGLTYSSELILRFVSAVLERRFVVLSGLSGSGKTKLAQAFVSWICKDAISKVPLFTVGQIISAARSDNTITDVFDGALVVAQGNGACAVLSNEIIMEWADVIKENGFTEDTPIGTIKSAVLNKYSKYSPQMHSFDSTLKALALYVIGKNVCTRSYASSLLIPVGADWTNSEHLLGYPDALQPGKYVMPDSGVLKMMLAAHDNPNLPFFLILDEMNLSHVERYFADFLSAMESGDDIKLYDGEDRFADGVKIPKTLKFPKNLFVIGTMNVDETTYMFSPKVLDRAQVIEFRVSDVEMAEFLKNPTTPNLDAIKGKGSQYAEAFLKLKDEIPELDASGSTNKDAIAEALNKFFPELAKLGAEFGYRTANEVMRFCAYYLAAGATIDGAIDAAIVQKLLPKLHGSRRKLERVLAELWKLCRKDGETDDLDVVAKASGDYDFAMKAKYPLSAEKVLRMFRSAVANGFASFAEA